MIYEIQPDVGLQCRQPGLCGLDCLMGSVQIVIVQIVIGLFRELGRIGLPFL